MHGVQTRPESLDTPLDRSSRSVTRQAACTGPRPMSEPWPTRSASCPASRWRRLRWRSGRGPRRWPPRPAPTQRCPPAAPISIVSARRHCACSTSSAPATICRPCAPTGSWARSPRPTARRWSAGASSTTSAPTAARWSAASARAPTTSRGVLLNWAIGENLAWGSGSRGTPRAIVRTWMHSARHRRSILSRRFRDVGIGVAAGAPAQDRSRGSDVHDGVRLPHHALGEDRASPTSLQRRWPASSRCSPCTTTPPWRVRCRTSPHRPYDVIDPEQRAELAARSPHNVVAIDLPEDPDGGDRYAHAATLLEQWRAEGAVVQDDEPALWAIVQDYTGPDGRTLTRNGFFARVRVEDYGPGAIRPHERTHPGPKEDRLRLTRATQANLSPIFSLYSDPELTAWRALEPATQADEPFGEVTEADGTRNRLWRIADPEAIAAVQDGDRRRRAAHRRRPPPLRDRARLRRRDRRRGRAPLRAHVPRRAAGRGPDGLSDPPPRQRPEGRQRADRGADRNPARRASRSSRSSADDLVPPGEGNGTIEMGYMDSHFKRAFRLTLKDQAIADAALADMPEPYRRLDTAVLEALVLHRPAGPQRGRHLAPQRPRLRALLRGGARARRVGRLRRRLLPARDPGHADPGDRRGGREHAPEVDVLLPEGSDRSALQSAERPGVASVSMNASAHRISGFRHVVKVRQHRLNFDEPVDQGGDDAAPSPQELLAASLASCTAVTMEMYADRKGWDLARRRGRVRVHARRARLPDEVHDHAAVAGRPLRRAGPAPEGHRHEVPRAPHARRRGHVRRACRAHPARCLTRCARSCWTPPTRPPWTSTDARRRRCSSRSTRMTARCTPSSPAAATTCAATPARSPSPAGAATTRTPTC